MLPIHGTLEMLALAVVCWRWKLAAGSPATISPSRSSSTVSSNTINASIDARYNFNTIGAFKSTLATGTAPMTVASTTPVAKFTAQYAQSTQYSGTTSGIGGGPLGAGICTTGSVVITGAATTMTVAVSPAADPGTGFIWEGFVSASNTITVRLCNITSGALTPGSTTYNVRVIQ